LSRDGREWLRGHQVAQQHTEADEELFFHPDDLEMEDDGQRVSKPEREDGRLSAAYKRVGLDHHGLWV
jgi:hypothetical protein